MKLAAHRIINGERKAQGERQICSPSLIQNESGDKMMLQKKKSGFILLEAVLAILLMSMASYGLAMISALQFNQLEAKQVANEAEQYAMNEVEYLRQVGFDDLDEALHDRKSNLEFSGVDGWESVTSFVTEKVIDDDRSVKIAKVEVYKEGENIPRYSMEVPLSSPSNVLPYGTIVPYVGALEKIPRGWALCDGSNGTPDLRGQFLQGVTNQDKVKKYIAAGLPNITGEIGPVQFMNKQMQVSLGQFVGSLKLNKNGPFGSAYFGEGFMTVDYVDDGLGYYRISLDASKENSIYGRSTTVQPNSFTVYYIIRIRTK